MKEGKKHKSHKKHKIGETLLCLLCSCLLLAQSPQVEWLYYGGDQAGTKYSPLADINRENVTRLQIAWQRKHWKTTT